MKRLLALLPLLTVTPAEAADCLLGKAIFGQPQSDWKVLFQPVPEERAGGTFSNRFTMPVPGSDMVIDGEVNWTNGFSQPWGRMTLNCQEGESQQTCLVWEGAVYQLADGQIDDVASERNPPPEQILFPDLGGSFWYGKPREFYGVRDVPEDVFHFEGCAAE